MVLFMKIRNTESLAVKVSINTIVVNILLTAFKLIAGFTAHSSAMISDAIHSASDVLSTVVVIIGVRMSEKKSDTDHQYGHERLECVAAVILAVMLGITGGIIGVSSVDKIADSITAHLIMPGKTALIAAVVSVIVKELMFWYTRSAAKKTNSGALMADAWHHRSDALSSVGSFAGILGARLGYAVLDPIAGVIICIFILKVSIDIFRDAVNKMTDKACDEDTINAIHRMIGEVDGVIDIDLLKTRQFGDKIYIDVEISVDGQMRLVEAHEIAENVHDKIENSFKNVKHCMVHVNPKL